MTVIQILFLIALVAYSIHLSTKRSNITARLIKLALLNPTSALNIQQRALISQNKLYQLGMWLCAGVGALVLAITFFPNFLVMVGLLGVNVVLMLSINKRYQETNYLEMLVQAEHANY